MRLSILTFIMFFAFGLSIVSPVTGIVSCKDGQVPCSYSSETDSEESEPFPDTGKNSDEVITQAAFKLFQLMHVGKVVHNSVILEQRTDFFVFRPPKS